MMTEPITYVLSYGMSKIVLTLTDDRFVSRAPMQNVDIPLSALRNFCLAPVVHNMVDQYDSQLIVSWNENGKVNSKKIYVRQGDVSFQQFLAALQQKRPDASLLHLPPAEAQKQMGVLSTNKMAWMVGLGIVVAILVAVLVLWLTGTFQS
jgi:hypothetical protein